MERSPTNGAEAPVTIGVLALQGDFHLHRQALDRVGVASVDCAPSAPRS